MHKNGTNKNLKSFTLIELLVVLALVAILSVVVVMTLNPAELIKQARDSNRLSDLSTINTALNLFSADVTAGFMGTSTVVYVSIPDNASLTCGSLGLPTLPSPYIYNCATTATLKNTDGTGWVPVNFQRISSNSPISQLPVDPVNTTSSGNYYTYVTGGSWKLASKVESIKYFSNQLTDGGSDMSVFEIGTNLNLVDIPRATNYSSCKAIKTAIPSSADGIYSINPSTANIVSTYCDMTSGGWTRVLTLPDRGAKTNNLLDKGIRFNVFRAVKATDHSFYKEANFSAIQTAIQGLVATATEANTRIMLSGPGGYGAYTSPTLFGECNWSDMNMIGAGYDGAACGSEGDLRVGYNATSNTLQQRFNVELYAIEQ